MSDLARQLIAENRKTRAVRLDLGNCGMTEIPGEIAELEWLEWLSLASWWFEGDGEAWHHTESRNSGPRNSQLRDLAPLSVLSRLKTLIAVGTPVSDLRPLARMLQVEELILTHTLVMDLSAIRELKRLRMLDLSSTGLADLSPIRELPGLEILRVPATRVSDLSSIAELRGLRMLDLSQTSVADLSPVSQIAGLRVLDISGAPVVDLSAVAGMKGLRELYASGTQVADLRAVHGLASLKALRIAGTPVADLSPLGELRALRTLDLSRTRVSDLSPLAGLDGLLVLDAAGTAVEEVSPLSRLGKLTNLNLSGTRVVDLSPLSGLRGLRWLNVSDTMVEDLSPLRPLAELETLVAARALVSDLSPLRPLIADRKQVRWSSQWWDGHGIYLEACPLTNPPVEIVTQGNEAILNYFRERDAGEVDHLCEAKLLILGEGGAGKTSLLRRLYQPDQELPQEAETTRGISIHRHEFPLKNGRSFRLNVWDFGGQEIYHATHQFFLTRRSLYLLLDDTKKDHKSVSDDGFKYWLDLIDVFGDHSPVLIFQNEKGGRSKTIDLAGIKGRYDNVKERYAGNLEQRDAADGVRAGIEFFAQALSHIGEELPSRWLQVRADLEARAREVAHIPHTEYFEIYGRHLELDRGRALHLSRYLHDVGVFLHFQDHPLLGRTVILQNAWVTEAVFRVLDDEAVKGRFGRFSQADCVRLWHEPAYADMHPELLALMQRFELCYELAESRPATWLLPQLLPPSKPAALGEWASTKPDDLVLRYVYEFLPKGMLSRLTVRLHRFVRDPGLAWATGVLFERDATAALVELLPNGREIELRARGPEQKALLSVIAADLDALNDSIEGLRGKADRRIPCNCTLCRAADVPEFFDQKKLVKRKEDGRLRVECPTSYEDVDVLGLLDGIRLESLPGWASDAGSSRALEEGMRGKGASVRERTIRIFLASSEELRADRDAFDLYFRQQNDRLREAGVYLEIARWENFLDAMSETRLQDEYNRAVRACDVFVSLFFTRTGKFTEEEFDTAHRQFLAGGAPRIYTFFKDAPIRMGSVRPEDVQSLHAFQKKLATLGHFWTKYDDVEHLKRQFRDQLDRLLTERG